MRYKIVQAMRSGGHGTELIVTECEGEQALFANVKVRGGGKFVRRQDALKYADGTSRRIPLRPELHNQPIFSGFCGPMYDGPGLVRYEDPTANDILSA